QRDAVQGKRPATLATTQSQTADGPDEVCTYMEGLRTEVRQLEQRVRKLQLSLQSAEGDTLRNVYTNALLRLTESFHNKQQELTDAEQTGPGANCSPKAAAKNSNTTESK